MIYAEAFLWDQQTYVCRTRAHDTAPDTFTAVDRATERSATGATVRAAVSALRGPR